MQIFFGLKFSELQGCERFFRRCTVAASAWKRSSTVDHFSFRGRAAMHVSTCIER